MRSLERLIPLISSPNNFPEHFIHSATLWCEIEDNEEVYFSILPNGVVLHDQGEGNQPPITSRSGSSQVPQGVNDVFND